VTKVSSITTPKCVETKCEMKQAHIYGPSESGNLDPYMFNSASESVSGSETTGSLSSDSTVENNGRSTRCSVSISISCSVAEDGFVSMRDSYWLPFLTVLSLSDTQQQPPIDVTFSELNCITHSVKFRIPRPPINLVETTLHTDRQP
jgi:hypothetical protein